MADTTNEQTVAYLREINQYKSNVLSSISHELRTPLNGTMVILDSLINGKEVSEKVKQEYLNPAIHSGEFLLNIIDGIMDFTQHNISALKLKKQPIIIRDFLARIKNIIQYQA